MRPSRLAPHFFGDNYHIFGLVAIAIIAIGMPASFSATQITLDTPKNSYSAGELISVKVQIADSPGQLVAIEVKDPAGITMMVRTVQTGSDGTFVLPFKLSPTAQSGSYDIVANSNINGYTIKTAKSISVASAGMEQKISTQAIRIPAWIKNNANWWSTGKIGDMDFKMGIGYMIKNGIIVIPSAVSSSDSSKNIPSWIKNDAGWWSEGKVSDFEFVGALQYLVAHQIITVK